MTAEQLIVLLTQIPFVVIALATIVQAVQRPRRSTIDIAVLFTVIAAIVIDSWLAEELGYRDHVVDSVVVVILLLSLPYLLLRVVSDLMPVSPGVQAGALVTFGILAGSAIVTRAELPTWVIIVVGLYFAALGTYTTRAFVIGARSSRGVTSRRLAAAAVGSAALGAVIVLASARAAVPWLDSTATTALSRLLSVVIGLGYFVAFSPPRILRHAWQQPELRSALARVAVLPRLPSTSLIIDELQHGAAEATGAQGAAIGLYDPESDTLAFSPEGAELVIPSGDGIAGRTFSSQRAIFSEDAPRDDPQYADQYRASNASAILAAPITAGNQRLGVLVVYAARPPIFADDDLQLVQLLADQAAVILESRALIDATTRVQAREQATMLRDEFLTAAAHDLRTPLTALISRTQLIGRRVARKPDTPIDPNEIKMIETDLLRLNELINELLDTARAERGQLIGERQQVDLAQLALDTRTRRRWDVDQLVVDAPEPVIAELDATRIVQLIDNLVENAVKYSNPGAEIRLAVGIAGDEARMTVTDHGVGIPPEDLPHIFDRFHRANNVSRVHTPGLGLGLYICRGIVEEHGGRIDVESTVGQGTTFTVSLPLNAPSPRVAEGSSARDASWSGVP